jgi:hypothetical protein
MTNHKKTLKRKNSNNKKRFNRKQSNKRKVGIKPIGSEKHRQLTTMMDLIESKTPNTFTNDSKIKLANFLIKHNVWFMMQMLLRRNMSPEQFIFYMADNKEYILEQAREQNDATMNEKRAVEMLLKNIEDKYIQ